MPVQTDGVSNLIGAIYDCIIEPDSWPDTLAELCRLTHLACGVLGANLLPLGEVLLSASVGYTPQWPARLNDYSEDVMNIWGGVERIASYPLEEPSSARGPRTRPPGNRTGSIRSEADLKDSSIRCRSSWHGTRRSSRA